MHAEALAGQVDEIAEGHTKEVRGSKCEVRMKKERLPSSFFVRTSNLEPLISSPTLPAPNRHARRGARWPSRRDRGRSYQRGSRFEVRSKNEEGETAFFIL